jgi:hypothetical protein
VRLRCRYFRYSTTPPKRNVALVVRRILAIVDAADVVIRWIIID